jgi:hypothetical protein
MLQLPMPEMTLFLAAALLYGIAAIVGLLHVSGRLKSGAGLLVPMVSLAACLEMVVLILRAVDIHAVPLTGLFESMLVLTVVLSLIYVFLGMVVPQIWFAALMTWVILVLAILAGVVAKPAAVPTKVAVTPWILFHAVAMLLSSVSIVCSTAFASLYLVANKKLKQRRVMSVLGRLPNVEWLRRATKAGLKSCFVTMTVGLASGVGLVVVKSASLGMGYSEWMVDPKIVLMAVAWCLLVGTLGLHAWGGLSDKGMAYATVFTFLVVIFAIVGVTLFCGTKHTFT